MVNVFQKHNSKWTETNVIMTDKDMNERDVLQEAFPDATLQLCLFHVLRCFRREVTIEAMAIWSAERALVHDFYRSLHIAILRNYMNLLESNFMILV